MPLGSRAATAAALAAACGMVSAADLAPASTSLCTPGQRVMFHCTFGARSGSLCADVKGQQITALSYRYGVAGRIEVSYVARAGGSQHFAATVAPLAPGASVRQIWFTRGGLTYLLSQCVGGACPQAAGLAVLRGERVLSNRWCLRSADDRAWFAPELARFGSDASTSQSLTGLLEFDDVDNGVSRLYPLR